MSAATAAAACTPVTYDVRVTGTTLTRNGSTWMPKGLQIRAFVSSRQVANNSGDTVTINAQDAYGQAELDKAKQVFGADELRFQVSQYSLSTGDAGYLKTVSNAINLARCNGFVVIISMQAEGRSGPDDRTWLPSQATKDAWLPLVNRFGADRGVMLEIYNEPGGPDHSLDTWQRWAHGGTGDFANLKDGDTPIYGMQPMIDYLRAKGSKNVLIVDAVQLASTFAGEAQLNSPLTDTVGDRADQILYGVHPYLRSPAAPDYPAPDYDSQFGTLSQQKPVIATEWSAREGSVGLGLGTPPDYRLALTTLNFLIKHRIPLSAGAFDAPGIMAQDLTSYAPTNYDHYDANKCAASKNNAGLLVQKMFSTSYFAQKLPDGPFLVLSDGVDGDNDSPGYVGPCAH